MIICRYYVLLFERIDSLNVDLKKQISLKLDASSRAFTFLYTFAANKHVHEIYYKRLPNYTV